MIKTKTHQIRVEIFPQSHFSIYSSIADMHNLAILFALLCTCIGILSSCGGVFSSFMENS
jgi:hypothetical protein